jgi:hypothetical protein
VEDDKMTWWEWFLWFSLVSIYITALFTVALMTFKKGRIILGILGIFMPFLWLVGAILPAKEGSRYLLDQEIRTQRQIEEYSR